MAPGATSSTTLPAQRRLAEPGEHAPTEVPLPSGSRPTTSTAFARTDRPCICCAGRDVPGFLFKMRGPNAIQDLDVHWAGVVVPERPGEHVVAASGPSALIDAPVVRDHDDPG